MRKALYLLILLVLPAQVCFGWSNPQGDFCQDSVDILPQAWQDQFDGNPTDPIYGGTNTIYYQLGAKYGWMPDHHDGPGQYDVATKRKMSLILYGELNGVYAVPTPYEDGGSEWTYHYFSSLSDTNDKCLRGSKWYFRKAAAALKDGDAQAMAMHLGGWGHAFQDRYQFYHAYDGRDSQRWAIYNDFDFWIIDDSNVEADISSYDPNLLGTDANSAAQGALDAMTAANAYTRSRGQDFADAHEDDDWENHKVGAATQVIVDDVALYGTKLCSEVYYTAFWLAYYTSCGLP